jgi:transcriptional regulator with XRE-family HTH domain
MTKKMTLKSVLNAMEPNRRKRVMDRGEQLARTYEALGELRKARSKTQMEVAAKLDVSQPYVAKLEQRSDLMLSVLRKYVRSVGGELELAVTFPDSGRVILDGLGEAEIGDAQAAKTRVRKKRSVQRSA